MKKIGVVMAALVFLVTVVACSNEPGKGVPWSEKAVRSAFNVGDKFIYDLTRKKGENENSYETHFEVKKVDGEQIHIISTSVGANDSGDYDTRFPKDGVSPLFDEMKKTVKVIGPEKVQAPAGTFDCTVIEFTDLFFIESKTLWMINDKPGIYAKVVEKKLWPDGETKTYLLKEIKK